MEANMPGTKIVCTIGPASEDRKVIEDLIIGGMNVGRLNFSHGTHEEHRSKIQAIRAISKELGIPVAILQDLCGPKIRIGNIPEPGVQLKSGQQFVLTNRPVEGTDQQVSVSYHDLPLEVKKDDRILLADGMMELVVQETGATDIFCKVVKGGVLTSRKGINLPTGTIKAPAITQKDRNDLLFGLAHDVDYVALSFVRSADDIYRLKDIIKKEKKNTPVIAKIEKHEALDVIDEIMAAADGIMVARGDLGVEIPLENVPNIQKMLIRKANSLGKPVIIATQMLRSMVDSPRPTRAEAADVANGVLDGADAVMLSEETASGAYPVQAVRYMRRIADAAETMYPHDKYLNVMPRKGVSASVAYAACILAGQLEAAAIVATTRSGSTAAHISRFRPAPKIIALSPDETAVRRLTLYWGCFPYHLKIAEDTDQMIEKAADAALESGFVSGGDQVVITAGRPVWEKGTTNMLWVKKL
jgi:pyruvate kinase